MITVFLFSDVGNASDNLDAASEAASNHSASSLELENDNENDNLSDMVSANVSGWGSPNISGEIVKLGIFSSRQLTVINNN